MCLPFANKYKPISSTHIYTHSSSNSKSYKHKTRNMPCECYYTLVLNPIVIKRTKIHADAKRVCGNYWSHFNWQLVTPQNKNMRRILKTLLKYHIYKYINKRKITNITD